MTAIFTESEYEIELSAVQGPAGPQGYSTPIPTGTFLANTSGSTAAPVARTPQQMKILSAVDTQTFTDEEKAILNGNLGKMTISQRDYENLAYIYLGGLVGTAWEVRRYSRSTAVESVASVTNNSLVTTLAAAWAIRTTLTYA